jgi:alanine-glyoxylate transaminase/serine-glyoxylate transaminase/serine-pyruvate transaminase
VQKALKENPDAKLLSIVHAETSTGVLQPLDDIVKMAHEKGLRVVVDAVTSLGGVEVPVDRLNLDFVYSGTQKCLNCPPGLSPVTVNESTANFIRDRESKCVSWYLDLGMIQRYWGSERFYHHTAPINMIYALHEALRAIEEEGLEARFARHSKTQQYLLECLAEIGVEPVVDERYRLPSLTTVWAPEGVDEAAARKRLLDEFNIEIGAGLGAFKGKVWRIGLMGVNSTKANVVFLMGALKNILGR